MRQKAYYVYILRNNGGMFYVGITNNLIRRLWEHQNKVVDGYTARYNINQLIYYELYSDPENAILREKQLKNWNRKKKILLIRQMNPTFREIPIEELS